MFLRFATSTTPTSRLLKIEEHIAFGSDLTYEGLHNLLDLLYGAGIVQFGQQSFANILRNRLTAVDVRQHVAHRYLAH